MRRSYVMYNSSSNLLRLLHRSFKRDGADLDYDARESSDKDFGHVTEWHMDGLMDRCARRPADERGRHRHRTSNV